MKPKGIESIYQDLSGGSEHEKCEFISRPKTCEDELYRNNIKIKHSMAEELMAMGLSEEAVERILRLDIAGNEGERQRAKGKRWRRL